MSRHRNLRQRHYSEDYDDYDDDIYSRSVEDEKISPGEESFIYDRSRKQPNISSFLTDVDVTDSPFIAEESCIEKNNLCYEPIVIQSSKKNITEGFIISDKVNKDKKKSYKNHSYNPGNYKNEFHNNSSKSNITNKHNPSPSFKKNQIELDVKVSEIQLPSSSNVPSYTNGDKELLERRDETLEIGNECLENKCKKNKEKENLYLIVIGHVDAGKSTLMGHFLYKLGYVTQKVIQKYEHESEKIGKQSFFYAWVLDEIPEERERGITIDVGKSKFETATKIVTLLDAPGHKDFIPNMISGATQADSALLVIDATVGEFETGFESGGQTREHTLLVRSLGVNQLAIVINKMDNVLWSRERFEEICVKLNSFLRHAGFLESDLFFIPCSGLTGENLIEKPKDLSAAWYNGPTLIDIIDSLKPPERSVNKVLRLSIDDVCKNGASGRIETGCIRVGNKVCIQPLGDIALVKGLTVDDNIGNTAYAGNYVNVILANVDLDKISVGCVLCNIENPIPFTNQFEAKIVIFDIVYPITIGYSVILHLLNFVDEVKIMKLRAQLNKVTGEMIKKNPRCLIKNSAAIVTIRTNRPICLELYKNIKEFGRFMLRDTGITIAAGLVTKIL